MTGAKYLETQALLLMKGQLRERTVSYTFFSPEQGLVTPWLRSSRTAPLPILDLFDEASLNLRSSNQGKTWFIQDYRILCRHEKIGRHRLALTCACRFARLLMDNPFHEESYMPLFNHCRTALKAWETGLHPEIVYLKGLFLYARDEGFPVKEQWLSRLPANRKLTARKVITMPLVEQTASRELVLSLTADLESYLRNEWEVRFQDDATPRGN